MQISYGVSCTTVQAQLYSLCARSKLLGAESLWLLAHWSLWCPCPISHGVGEFWSPFEFYSWAHQQFGDRQHRPKSAYSVCSRDYWGGNLPHQWKKWSPRTQYVLKFADWWFVQSHVPQLYLHRSEVVKICTLYGNRWFIIRITDVERWSVSWDKHVLWISLKIASDIVSQSRRDFRSWLAVAVLCDLLMLSS